MHNSKIRLFATIGVSIFGSLLAFRMASASQLFLYPQEYDIAPNQKLIVDIRLDAKLDQVNVVKMKLRYPVAMLKVEDISTRGSFLSLFAESPNVDRASGEITLTGGIPHGSYVIGAKVATITFEPLVPGTAELVFDQTYSSVLKNDGKGSPTVLSTVKGTYHIIEAITDGIEITSPTHPSETVWYRSSGVTLQWAGEANAQYSYVITTNPFEVPDSNLDEFTGSVSYTDIDDGVHYFIVSRHQDDQTWKIVGRRRILIDKTPPSPIEYALGRDASVYGGKNFIAFTATDAASGISRFEIQEGRTTTSSITSPYVLLDQSLKSALILRAFDFAGNKSEVVIREGTTYAWWYAVILGIIVLGGMLLIWILIKSRKKKKERENTHEHLTL